MTTRRALRWHSLPRVGVLLPMGRPPLVTAAAGNPRRPQAAPLAPRPLRFGSWHLLEGPSGVDKLREALKQLGQDYQVCPNPKGGR
jgi:hypothetical protein